MAILNLTQHTATASQTAVGVIDFPPEAIGRIAELLTFDTVPSKEEVKRRASLLALEVLTFKVAHPTVEITAVMIGGAPFLMSKLERKLKQMMFKPVYAFSRRISQDRCLPDGDVVKHSVFKHVGFVEA